MHVEMYMFNHTYIHTQTSFKCCWWVDGWVNITHLTLVQQLWVTCALRLEFDGHLLPIVNIHSQVNITKGPRTDFLLQSVLGGATNVEFTLTGRLS